MKNNRFSRFLARLTDRASLPGHQLYIGKYHDGYVRCEYVERDGEQVFDGPFAYEYAAGGGWHAKIYDRAKGTFAMNRKDGQWFMEHGDALLQRQLTVTFVSGHLQGPLTYRNEDKDYLDNITETQLSLTVSGCRVRGQITGQLNGGAFKGSCDDDGLPDGQWSLQAGTGTQMARTDVEMWSHGTLISATTINTARKDSQPMKPYLRQTVSELLNREIMDMLYMVRRGTRDTRIELPHDK